MAWQQRGGEEAPPSLSLSLTPRVALAAFFERTLQRRLLLPTAGRPTEGRRRDVRTRTGRGWAKEETTLEEKCTQLATEATRRSQKQIGVAFPMRAVLLCEIELYLIFFRHHGILFYYSLDVLELGLGSDLWPLWGTKAGPAVGVNCAKY